MDVKRKSTLGKAFGGLFSRKPNSQTKSQPDNISPENREHDNDNPQLTATDLPADKSTPAHDTNQTTHDHVHVVDTKPISNDHPIPNGDNSIGVHNNSSPEFAGLTQPMTNSQNTNIGDNQNNKNTDSPPKSPIRSTVHTRDGTELTHLSGSSHQGVSSSEDLGIYDGTNPADILLHRLMAYKMVLKNLQQYFTEIALIESDISKAMYKSLGMITLPFKDGNQFLGKGGLQDVCFGIRDSTKIRSDQHEATARFVEETVVKSIRRLKQDIKGRVKSLKSDTSLYENRAFKEREATQELIGNLAKAIGLFENVGGHQSEKEKVQSDPYLINISLRRQIAKQVREENHFARTLQQCQERIMIFEKHIISEIKQVLGSFAQYQINNSGTGFSQSWTQATSALNGLQEDTEWNNFLEQNKQVLLPSELVDSDPDQVDYPCKNSPYVIPIRTAHLSRRSTVLKHWKEGYFVLTMSGWLHAFPSADYMKDPVPERSIYIPTATLGPSSDSGSKHKQHVFSLEGKGMSGLLHREAQKFTLRANSREEMLDWWEEISKRAYSTMHIEFGHSDTSLSRGGSVLRSSSLMRSGSKANKEAIHDGDKEAPQGRPNTQSNVTKEVPMVNTIAPSNNAAGYTDHTDHADDEPIQMLRTIDSPIEESKEPTFEPVSQPAPVNNSGAGSTMPISNNDHHTAPNH